MRWRSASALWKLVALVVAAAAGLWLIRFAAADREAGRQLDWSADEVRRPDHRRRRALAPLAAGETAGNADTGAAAAPALAPSSPPGLGPELARLGVAAIDEEADDFVRTTRLVDSAGNVVGSITRPAAPTPGMRTLEIELLGNTLAIELEQPDDIAEPTIRLRFDDGDVVAGPGAPTGQTLPDAFAPHIRLLDAFQREGNQPLLGDEPIQLARDRACGQDAISGHGTCFGDCADLACRRAHAGLNRKCAGGGGCCEVEECSASCTRVPTDSGELVAVCSAHKVGRLAAAAR